MGAGAYGGSRAGGPTRGAGTPAWHPGGLSPLWSRSSASVLRARREGSDDRTEGGHRRYSRYQLRIAARARELVDQDTPIEAACRIVILEDQLEEAQRINAEYRSAAESANPTAAT
ncbi:hypothetical protein ACFQ77_30365 [Streptomyces virginiae]|uniref:hypothetical protein n=1 Tax=Streptomyces virginiae TaxID=1961 RepID=UPI0036CFD119